MDMLYCAGWLYVANWRKVRRTGGRDRPSSASGPSGIVRLVAALVVIALVVALLGVTSNGSAVVATSQAAQAGERQ